MALIDSNPWYCLRPHNVTPLVTLLLPCDSVQKKSQRVVDKSSQGKTSGRSRKAEVPLKPDVSK